MSISISVIICTHNPRVEYLREAVEALRAQTLSAAHWELLIIDNASAEAVSRMVDVSWHPQGRIILERRLGLTPARLRGVQESAGDLIVFVDDDNVLDSHYLEAVQEISRVYPHLGAWGGAAVARFEQEPEAWMRPYLEMLALREVERDEWSNATSLTSTTPHGAGICVRRVVAIRYMEALQVNERRRSLDRVGANLSSCGDTDLALTAPELGYGTGVFKSLRLTHLIPAGRVQMEYLERLREEIAYSLAWLRYARGDVKMAEPITWRSRIRDYMEVRQHQSAGGRRLTRALLRGRRRARRDIRQVHLQNAKAGAP